IDKSTKYRVVLTKYCNRITVFDYPVPPFLEATRREAIRLILEPYLGKDTDLYRWRKMAILQKFLTDRPSKWLPPAYKSFDELIVAAADAAVQSLQSVTGNPKVGDWQWKNFNALEMQHPIGRKAPF